MAIRASERSQELAGVCNRRRAGTPTRLCELAIRPSLRGLKDCVHRVVRDDEAPSRSGAEDSELWPSAPGSPVPPLGHALLLLGGWNR